MIAAFPIGQLDYADPFDKKNKVYHRFFFDTTLTFSIFAWCRSPIYKLLPMKITPLEIRNQQFSKANFRGYSIEDVDTFLGNLALEWERIVNESIMLRMQLDMAEKEAAKFREIQMTLIKTLKTAEDTGNMITDQANFQAEKNLQEAASKSEQILTEAYAEANRLKFETEREVHQMKEGISVEIQELERTCRTLEHYRNTLLVQLKSLANTTLDHVESFDISIPAYTPAAPSGIQNKDEVGALEVVQTESVEEITPEIAPSEDQKIAPVEAQIDESSADMEMPAPEFDLPESMEEEAVAAVEHDPIEERAVAAAEHVPIAPDISVGELESRESAIAEDILAQLKAEVVSEKTNVPAYDDFTRIQGITPEIHQALLDSGITTFRALSCLPAYKVFEFLHKKGVGNDELDIHGWTQHAYRLSGGQIVIDEPLTAVAEEGVQPITPLAQSKPNGNPPAPAPAIDFEDKTLKIIQSIRTNMQLDGKTNGKPRKEGEVSPRLEELLKHRKKDQNTGSFFDNL